MNLTMECLNSLMIHSSETHHLKVSLRIRNYSDIEHHNIYFYKGLYTSDSVIQTITDLKTEFSEEVRGRVEIDIVDFCYLRNNIIPPQEGKLSKIHCFLTDIKSYMYFYSQLTSLEEIYNYLDNCWGSVEILEIEAVTNHYDDNDGEF